MLACIDAFRCVEVGCGSGYVITSAVRIIAASCSTACRFIATDISEPALAATRATLEAHKVRGVKCMYWHLRFVAILGIIDACMAKMRFMLVQFMLSCVGGQVHGAVDFIAADLLGPLLPRLRQKIDLLVTHTCCQNCRAVPNDTWY
jgi:SAM-dependent methyltransferase